MYYVSKTDQTGQKIIKIAQKNINRLKKLQKLLLSKQKFGKNLQLL